MKKISELDAFAMNALLGIMSNGYEIKLRDEDMIEDKDGRYVKKNEDEGEYVIKQSKNNFSKVEMYSIKTTQYERMVREAYDIAEAMLKESERRKK